MTGIAIFFIISIICSVLLSDKLRGAFVALLSFVTAWVVPVTVVGFIVVGMMSV